MVIPLPLGIKIWLVTGITDMLNGFNDLAAKVLTALCLFFIFWMLGILMSVFSLWLVLNVIRTTGAKRPIFRMRNRYTMIVRENISRI